MAPMFTLLVVMTVVMTAMMTMRVLYLSRQVNQVRYRITHGKECCMQHRNKGEYANHLRVTMTNASRNR